jgi:SAM-dependent methyltransferase
MSRPPQRWEDHEAVLAQEALEAGDPTGWFDELYRAGADGRTTMPWDRTTPHPLLHRWTRQHPFAGIGHDAVVVGCGLGADAEHIASLGYRTVAFDISAIAINLARRRHQNSAVEYKVADLLALCEEWVHRFDLVVEVITVQALPDPPRRQAIVNVGRLVADGGTLIVIEAVRHPSSAPPAPNEPWPLDRDEIDAFATDGLRIVDVDVARVGEEPGDERWIAEFRRDRALTLTSCQAGH